MKLIIFVMILLAFSSIACKSSFNELPVPNNEDCQAKPISQSIIGQWKFASNFTGSHQYRYSGTISFNQDGSLSDTDSLLSSGSKSAPVIKKSYTVKGDTLRLITITTKDTLVFGGIASSKQCNQLVFSSWFYLVPSPAGLVLTLTKP